MNKLKRLTIKDAESQKYMNLILELFHIQDPYTYGHSSRVANLARRLGEYMHLPEKTVNKLELAGYLHDIGKVKVPEKILYSNDKLSDEEKRILNLHPQMGYEIIEPIASLEGLLPVLLFHHERYDGAGYPIGLKGDEIPYIARLITVIDSFDAMASDRPYRKRMGLEEIIFEIQANKGKQFDPEIANSFCDLLVDYVDEVIEIYHLY